MTSQKVQAQRKLWQELEKAIVVRPNFNRKGQVLDFEDVPAKDMLNRLIAENEEFRLSISSLIRDRLQNFQDCEDEKRSSSYRSGLSSSFQNQHGARIYIGPGSW